MQIDFLHNQIIRDTVTDKFIDCFNENLLPRLKEIYGEALSEVQFYEDHLSDGFRINGEFYYPLTLVLDGKAITQWIKWQVANYRVYDKFNPYTYKGNKTLEFSIVDEVPASVKATMSGRVIYSDSNALPIAVTSPAEDKTFLSGKYSQCFVDEMAHRVTELIEREFSIIGLADSGVTLELHFAPGSFLEHVVENTTYRRLLIKAKGCGARDLWIKWTRLDLNGTYTVNDAVSADDVIFELAEDVSNRIKEKEYRALMTESAEKYRAAMSRKNITEWRELMRRVIRRAEVEKLETESAPLKIQEVAEEPFVNISTELARPEFAVGKKNESDVSERLAAMLGDSEEESDEDEEEINSDLTDLLKSVMGMREPKSEEENEEVSDEPILEDEPIVEEEKEPVTVSVSINETDSADTPSDENESIRAELEAKVRAELEDEIRKKHEEAEMLRARLEAQLRAETREKELIAEAARAAIEEQRRIEEERKAERLLREEEERIAEAKRAEEAAKIAEEKRIEEERRKADEAARSRLTAEETVKNEDSVKYVSKTVRLIFKYSVSATVTKRIHEIILATIKYFNKEDVYIRIKATVPDSTTVNLEFTKIPESEIPLLVNIIKVLGRSDLGIIKAILD